MALLTYGMEERGVVNIPSSNSMLDSLHAQENVTEFRVVLLTGVHIRRGLSVLPFFLSCVFPCFLLSVLGRAVYSGACCACAMRG